MMNGLDVTVLVQHEIENCPKQKKRYGRSIVYEIKKKSSENCLENVYDFKTFELDDKQVIQKQILNHELK